MKGIVIKQADTAEGNRIIWIFTSDYGILKAVGRGAAKTRSQTAAGSQFLTYGDFELYPGRDMHTLTGASPEENFSSINGSITKLSLVSYFCDIVYKHLGLNNPDNDMFRLLLNCIYALANMNISEQCVKAVFEARAACDIGYMPVLDCCILCGEVKGCYNFDLKNGGVVCDECGNGIKITSAAAAAWKYISACPPERIFSFEADEECIENLGSVTEAYIEHHTSQRLGSLKYYKEISHK